MTSRKVTIISVCQYCFNNYFEQNEDVYQLIFFQTKKTQLGHPYAKVFLFTSINIGVRWFSSKVNPFLERLLGYCLFPLGCSSCSVLPYVHIVRAAGLTTYMRKPVTTTYMRKPVISCETRISIWCLWDYFLDQIADGPGFSDALIWHWMRTLSC